MRTESLHRPLLALVTTLAVQALATIAMLAAARTVIREVRGLAAARPPRRGAKPVRRTEAAEAEANADDVGEWADPAADAATLESDEEESSTDYVDGSEQEHRHLSKAERKRLKKLARMNRSVA